MSCWESRFCAECGPLSEPLRKLILKQIVIRFIFLGSYRRSIFCVSVPRYLIEPVDKANQVLKAFKVFFLLTPKKQNLAVAEKMFL